MFDAQGKQSHQHCLKINHNLDWNIGHETVHIINHLLYSQFIMKQFSIRNYLLHHLS